MSFDLNLQWCIFRKENSKTKKLSWKRKFSFLFFKFSFILEFFSRIFFVLLNDFVFLFVFALSKINFLQKFDDFSTFEWEKNYFIVDFCLWGKIKNNRTFYSKNTGKVFSPFDEKCEKLVLKFDNCPNYNVKIVKLKRVVKKSFSHSSFLLENCLKFTSFLILFEFFLSTFFHFSSSQKKIFSENIKRRKCFLIPEILHTFSLLFKVFSLNQKITIF